MSTDDATARKNKTHGSTVGRPEAIIKPSKTGTIELVWKEPTTYFFLNEYSAARLLLAATNGNIEEAIRTMFFEKTEVEREVVLA